MRFVILFIASAGFTGYAPFVSGTVGTVVAVPCFWIFDDIRSVSTALYLLIFVLLVAGACWIAGKAEQLLQEHDSGRIVIDEVVGYLGATLFLSPTWGHTVVAFLLFRLFDIVKPFPARYIDEHVSGGYGIVLDDVVAGLYANLATRLVFLMV